MFLFTINYFLNGFTKKTDWESIMGNLAVFVVNLNCENVSHEAIIVEKET